MRGIMPAQTVDHCPNCGEDLRALPPPNRCPECGFEYDTYTRVWQSRESWGRVACLYTAGGLVAGLVISVLYRLSFANAPYPALPLLLGLIAPIAGLTLRRLVSGRISGRFVALTPGGVLVGTRPTPLLVPWDAVERLIEERGVPKLRCHEAPTLVPLDDIFTGPAEVDEFGRTLQAALARHRGGGSPALR
jgi:hypothetical protein